MEIETYDLYEVPPRWLLLKLTASDGTVGWGEPIVEGKAGTVRAAVGELVDRKLLGADPLSIEDAWQTMYRGEFYRGGPILMSAIAGIDQALWDLKGKHLDLPAFELLGGRCRDRIEVFRWVGGDQPEQVAERATELVETGYGALKMDATTRMSYVDTPEAADRIVERVATVREAVGSDVSIALDFRGRISPAMAKRLLPRLDAYDLLFVEEPVLPEHDDRLPAIAAETNTPIATGERRYSRWEFRQLFVEDAVDVIQPNVSHSGGLTETRKIANAAEAFGVGVAPNCPTGPLTLATTLQLAACTPSVFIQDHGYDVHPGGDSTFHEYVEDPSVFASDDGFVEIPEGPGLGVRIDEAVVESRAEESIGWSNPVWRHEDGSVSDW